MRGRTSGSWSSALYFCRESCQAVAIVLASVIPFGQTGPYRDYRGSELTLQALARSLTISIDNNLACFPRVDLVPVIRHAQAWPRRYRHTSVRPNIADAITIVVRVDRWL